MPENRHSALSPATPASEMYEKEEEGHYSAPRTPVSQTATLALDINNPADLEAQLLRLRQRQDTDLSNAETECGPNDRQTRTWTAFLRQEISSDLFMQCQCLILSLATGIIDAITFASYSVFISKQTGNTVFIALAALEHGSVAQTEPNVAVSISLFIAGAIIFGHAGHHVGSSKRLWLLVSNIFGSALVYAAAALEYWGSQRSRGCYALGCLALLSFSWGGQVSMAFALKVPDINTTMVTGSIVQIASDVDLFSRHNAARNRRVAFFLAMLIGAFVGSAVAGYAKPCLGILIVAILKTIVTVMFLFDASKDQKPRKIWTYRSTVC